MLDTGLRASEICGLIMVNLDMNNKQITAKGKGKKQRILEISNKTAQTIWRYLITRPKLSDDDSLFVGKFDLPLTRGGLLQLTKRTGKRAGVRNAHPHRFRHTFAINFLRNGGNIYALQEQLGHSSLDMVKRYLKLSEQDCAAVHRIASPVIGICRNIFCGATSIKWPHFCTNRICPHSVWSIIPMGNEVTLSE